MLKAPPQLLGAVLLLLGSTLYAVDLPTTELLEVVPGPPETRSTPFIAWDEDLSRYRYVEQEYQVSGFANLYEYVDNAAQDSTVRVRDADVPYTTRVLVRRPQHAKRFNGTLYLEVLNPTAGWDGDPIWQNTYRQIIRSGGAYVGVTSKPVALNFLRDGWGSTPGFAVRNNERYANLEMPYFGQVWDILSEIGALLKTRNDPHNPLQGFKVRRIVLVGYSQSVAYQVTYANSFHERARMPNGKPVIDGYYLAAGGARGKNVNRPTPDEESLPAGDARNFVSVKAPVVRFQTQTEIVNFPSYTVRQTEPEFPLVRTYEMAGGAHVDQVTNDLGGIALARDLGLPNFGALCDLTINPIRIGFVQSALLQVTEDWVRKRRKPPPSRLMQLTTAADGSKAVALDLDGNAVGGQRPPRLDVPLGTYLPTNTGGGFCFLFGGYNEFDQAELAHRYPSHRRYVRKVFWKVVKSVSQRFLLPHDGVTLIKEALRSDIGRTSR
ncbi:MAG: alpha/beta hydrolase domain-containing protein [Pseudomonadales bacterium]